METSLTTNSIAFIGLCNEFCMAIGNARETERSEFLDADDRRRSLYRAGSG